MQPNFLKWYLLNQAHIIGAPVEEVILSRFVTALTREVILHHYLLKLKRKKRYGFVSVNNRRINHIVTAHTKNYKPVKTLSLSGFSAGILLRALAFSFS